MEIDIEKIDKNLVPNGNTKRDDAVFHSIRKEPFHLYGLGGDGKNGEFVRVPMLYAEKLDAGMQIMNGMLSGVRARFKTDSPYIIIRVETPSVTPITVCGTLVSMKGFDVYIRDETGEERYHGSLQPPVNFKDGYEAILNLPGTLSDITLYFPYYNQITDVFVGLSKNAVLTEGSLYKHSTPILFYGSSITQGCSASRTGNSYECILSRKLDTDIINLGVSGGAKAQMPMAEYIAASRISALVYDYDHNAPDAEYLQNTHEKFFRYIRERQPALPVVMMTKPDHKDPEREKRRNIIFNTYQNAKKSGDNQVYFIDGKDFFENDEDADVATADGVHPNDYGFLLMAKKMQPILKKILTE